MIVLALLVGCDGGGEAAPAQVMAAATEETTFATATGLGSFHLKASVKRTESAASGTPQSSQETLEIRWQDTDHWSYTLGRDGRVRTEVVVWDSVAWARNGNVALERKPDAEPYRVQLATVWDPWEWGLESLASHVVYDAGELELVEGRRVHHHRLALAPPPPKPRRGWSPSAVAGDVWIDEATALRLKGRVVVDAVAAGRTRQVELLFSIADIGLNPGVSPPAGDKP